jgi:pimeloyl-ACP methyl ester carboxylesterase
VHDPALGKELTHGLERWVPSLTVQYLDCGHWTQQERPDEVNRYLLEFLSQDGQDSGSPR